VTAVVPATATLGRAAATATPRAAVPATATPTTAPSANAQALPTVATQADQRGPGFLTPVELELILQQPIGDASELRRLVDGVQSLDGIASVRGDGQRVVVRYDSTRVLPARIRQQLTALGHPARPGTEVQNPGDAAD
jgi:hypothetical protein